MQLAAANPGKPIVIADTQDNPGGGGDGDTTGMLRALVAAKADAVLGLMIDADAAAAAHKAGIGSAIEPFPWWAKLARGYALPDPCHGRAVGRWSVHLHWWVLQGLPICSLAKWP